MLIIEQAKKKFRAPQKVNTYLLGLLALGLSLPFGLLSAYYLQSWLAGLVLGSSLFTYTILLVQLVKRQPPIFLRRFFGRKELSCPRNINETCALRLDYIGSKDPQDSIDGVVHNHAGELQRILRCSLPQRISFNGQSILLEMLFADLSQFEGCRFQLIFPETDNGRRKEMIIVASYMLVIGDQSPKQEAAPLVQMQNILDRLMERLITLGIAPKVLNAFEVRQLISQELGSSAGRSQLNRDWRNMGNLGWEPSFRDITLKANDRFMQVAEKRSFTMAIEQLPASGSFEWLSAVLADIPNAHVSLFISQFNASDPLTKIRMSQKLKHHPSSSKENGLVVPSAAKMSFFLRFDSKDGYQLESEVSAARKYLASMGIHNSFHTHRQQQLQNWRASLPCAQEQNNHKHLIAFMRSTQQPGSRA